MSLDKKPDNPWYYYLNSQLIKKRKPCLPGDYVHLKSFSGCYRVYSVRINCFVIMKNRELIEVCWEQFRCLKGEGQSEEAQIKKDLRALINTIDISISKQTMINIFLHGELQNLRKTFI